MRWSTIFSLPLQLVFPAFKYVSFQAPAAKPAPVVPAQPVGMAVAAATKPALPGATVKSSQVLFWLDSCPQSNDTS
jgi:hypothetical protein